MADLEIRDLYVSVEGKEILKGVNLTVNKGETHALMGPNGSGKTSLSYTLMGHPGYKVESGDILLKGASMLGLSPDKRARLGMFLAFQYPSAVPGVSVPNFLRTALGAIKRRGDEEPQDEKGRREMLMPPAQFRKVLREKMQMLKMDESFTKRYLNDGFSGGEKKRMEMLQMAILQPEIAILDETDSGLDIDALRTIADGVNGMAGPDLGILIITHYQRILNYVKPDFVHVLLDGRIVREGGIELVEELEKHGYEGMKPVAVGV